MRTSRLLFISCMLIAVGTVRSEALAIYGVCDPVSFYDKTKLGAPPDGPVDAQLVDVTVECACQQDQPGNGTSSNSETKWQTAHIDSVNLGTFTADNVTYDSSTGYVTVFKIIQPGPTVRFNQHFQADGSTSPTHLNQYPKGDHVCKKSWYEIDHSCDPKSLYVILSYLGNNDKERYRIERSCEHNSTRERDGTLTSHYKSCYLCDNPDAPADFVCDWNCQYTCITTFEGKVTGKGQ